jgi:2-desacetyl-2-hydroxyethyl bacteriochlorophyllide A dehydrogenase
MAVVIERPGEAVFREVEEPAVGPDDVLVRSRRAGVCRTDLELFGGELDPRWVRYPCIPGHEWSGVVEEVGANVTEFKPGERVVCEGIIPCERCRRCRAGETNICENYDQLGFTRAGGYAELVVAPQRVVHRLPDHVSFEAAVLIEPGSVVLRGLERAQLRTGESVGVVGTGTLGSLALVLSQLYAPSRLVAFGIRDEELELAGRLGAQSAVNVERNPPDGDDLDVVVETAGAVPAVELATRLAREGGRVVLLGIAGAGRSLELPADRIALRDLALLGLVGYTRAVWSRMVGLARDQLVELDPIVTHRFPASEFRQAFDLLDRRDGAVAKIVLEHAA